MVITFKELMEKYVYCCKASGRSDSAIINVNAFYRWSLNRFPNEEFLSQDIIYQWWVRTERENHITYRSRIYKVLPFLRYVNGLLHLPSFDIPPTPPYAESISAPHYFTEQELSNFFGNCDGLTANNSLSQRLRKKIVPVIFRLLYSTGLRVLEARMLNRCDVDFKTGIIAIRQTKGHMEHFVVLHDSMRELLESYDSSIEKLLPNRKALFPDEHDNYHRNKWLSDQFRVCWYKQNADTAYARELRHQYAIENINSWHNDEYDTYYKLVALKNSMGHSKLSRTLYYYSLAPIYGDLIESRCQNSFDDIIPIIPQENETK
jgi:integrase